MSNKIIEVSGLKKNFEGQEVLKGIDVVFDIFFPVFP